MIQQCVRICHPDRTVPYPTLPFRDLPFPRFGLKNRGTVAYNRTVFRFLTKSVYRTVAKKHRFPFLFLSASRTAPNSLPCSVFSLKSANRTVQSSLPFSVRILYREPYRSKKRTVFRLFTKSANRTEPKIINFSVFTIKKTVNGPYFGTVRFAIKIENGKRFCFCYGTVRAFLP